MSETSALGFDALVASGGLHAASPLLGESPEGDAEYQPEDDCQGQMIPFLRWPGGKRWFVASYRHLILREFDRYFEPFLGGGSMYFYLKPAAAVIGDVNVDVIRAFKGVRDFPETVQALLEHHHLVHSKDHYYAVRDAVPESLAEQAARIIYLNRTCFNGIYRLNRAGRFNVPIGERSQVVFETDDFPRVSRMLRGSEIHLGDFEEIIDRAQRGDFVFADPPYTVRHNMNGFVKYNENLFSWADQVRLAGALYRAMERGVGILSTNAAHESVRELYEHPGFTTRTISRFSPIAAQSASRKQFSEFVISA